MDMNRFVRARCWQFLARAALGFGFIGSALFATSETFVVDPANSKVEFRVRHLAASVTGQFSRFAGEFTLDRERPENNAVKFTVDAASLATDDARRTARLAREDFFATSRFPTIRFESTNWKIPHGPVYELAGNLTVKAITKATTVRVMPPGGERTHWEVTAKLDRRDFEVVGGPPGLIGNEIEVRISLATQSITTTPSSPSLAITMVTPEEPGQRLTLHGTVYAADSTTPLPGAKLYVFHTDASGRYSPSESGIGDERNPRLHSRLVTDDRGRFEIRTILPGPYPGGKTQRHLHLIVTAPDGRDHNATFSFAGDPNLTADDYRRHGQDGTFSSIRPLERDADGTLRCVRNIRFPPAR
jgi:polyisoprenoid-binding protein YceI